MVAIPKLPRIERFCFCMEVRQGVTFSSLFLVGIWILYLISVAIQGSSASGNAIWGAIWCIINICVYGLVVFTLWKDKSRNFLLPALCFSAFDVLACIIQMIINFVFLNIFGAIVILIIGAITLYYFLALKTVYDDLGGAVPDSGEPAGDIKQPA